MNVKTRTMALDNLMALTIRAGHNFTPNFTTYIHPDSAIGMIKLIEVVGDTRVQIGTEVFSLKDNPEINEILDECIRRIA